jgi:probable HAF family extracellular repeat protein
MLGIHRTVLVAALGLVLGLPALVSSAATSVASPSQQTPDTQLAYKAYKYTDLGVLGDPGSGPESSAARSINNAGQVVGASTTDVFAVTHAFLWQNGQLRDLGVISNGTVSASAAYGIKNAGDIVGQTNVDPANEPPHDFLLIDLNGVVANLPADVVLESARAISDDGRIAGTSYSGFCEPGATAPSHAFLLTPIAR